MIDETTDAKGEMPIAVLVQPNRLEFNQPIMIDMLYQSEVSTGEEPGTNSIDIQHVYHSSLTDKKIPLNAVDAFVVDGAKYIKSSYTALSRHYPRVIFIWCFCHMLNRFFFCYIMINRLFAKIYDMPEFQDIRSIMKNLKMLFRNSNIRKKKWKSFQRDMNHLVFYSLTRWGSWILGIKDLFQYLDILPQFINELTEYYKKKNKDI